jgi:MFS family permease
MKKKATFFEIVILVICAIVVGYMTLSLYEQVLLLFAAFRAIYVIGLMPFLFLTLTVYVFLNYSYQMVKYKEKGRYLIELAWNTCIYTIILTTFGIIFSFLAVYITYKGSYMNDGVAIGYPLFTMIILIAFLALAIAEMFHYKKAYVEIKKLPNDPIDVNITAKPAYLITLRSIGKWILIFFALGIFGRCTHIKDYFDVRNFGFMVPSFITCLIPFAIIICYTIYVNLEDSNKNKFQWISATSISLVSLIAFIINLILLKQNNEMTVKAFAVFFPFFGASTILIDFLAISLVPLLICLIALINFFVKMIKSKAKPNVVIEQKVSNNQ